MVKRARSTPTKLRRSRGRWAEGHAVAYLEREGFEILARNRHLARGELDIVAREGRVIVFVEVRSRRYGGAFSPEGSLSLAKRHRLVGAARCWLALSGLGEVYCRFDLIAVRFGPQGVRLRHYRGAFVDDF